MVGANRLEVNVRRGLHLPRKAAAGTPSGALLLQGHEFPPPQFREGVIRAFYSAGAPLKWSPDQISD